MCTAQIGHILSPMLKNPASCTAAFKSLDRRRAEIVPEPKTGRKPPRYPSVEVALGVLIYRAERHGDAAAWGPHHSLRSLPIFTCVLAACSARSNRAAQAVAGARSFPSCSASRRRQRCFRSYPGREHRCIGSDVSFRRIPSQPRLSALSALSFGVTGRIGVSRGGERGAANRFGVRFPGRAFLS